MTALPRKPALHHRSAQKAHAAEHHAAKPKTQRILKTHKRSSVLANHWSRQARGKKPTAIQERSFINRAITYAVAEQARRAKAAAEIKKEVAEEDKKAALAKLAAAVAGKKKATVKAKPKASKSKKVARKHKAKGKAKAAVKKKQVVHRVARTVSAKKPAAKKMPAAKKAVHHAKAKARGNGLDHELLKQPARWQGWPSGTCYRSPWCTAASIADCICVLTEGRTILTRRQISSLYYSALLRPAWPFTEGIVTLPNALDAAVSLGYIWDWHPLDHTDPTLIGTVCGIQLAHGDHAVALAGNGDCILYGQRIPCPEIDNGEQYIIRV